MQDKPQYTEGDVVEVFNPQSNAYQWITVESVLVVHGSQIILACGSYFCECWVRTESLATPDLKVMA
ncbi:MAG TPA: hypothetical protein VF528_14515 [Pyrinomonadaceae bacterium]|jgi:hypothetical protein